MGLRLIGMPDVPDIENDLLSGGVLPGDLPEANDWFIRAGAGGGVRFSATGQPQAEEHHGSRREHKI